MTFITDPNQIPNLFGDPAGAPVLNYQAFDLISCREKLDKDGYVIVRGLVPTSSIDRVRSFWMDTFTNKKPDARITWGPYIGQPNTIGFTSDTFQHLYRACDFLWNEPLHPLTREICIRTHALRNLLIERDPFLGVRFIDGRYGIFITSSYYPGGSGRMDMHDDGVADRSRLVHSLVPITFKGTDYKEGGLVLMDKHGNKVDVDGAVKPGDVLFYDGSLKHGVMPIVPHQGSTMGRMQIFPIPGVFSNLEDNIFALARVPFSRIFSAKKLLLKNKVRIMLGLKPAMR